MGERIDFDGASGCPGCPACSMDMKGWYAVVGPDDPRYARWLEDLDAAANRAAGEVPRG